MRHITLEIPLGAFALVRRGQRGDPAHARIHPLGDALDDAALASGVAAFKQNHHLVAAGNHPVLQLDQLALQPKQLAKILAAALALLDFVLLAEVQRLLAGQLSQRAVFQLHFQLFIVAVDQIIADTPHHFIVN